MFADAELSGEHVYRLAQEFVTLLPVVVMLVAIAWVLVRKFRYSRDVRLGELEVKRELAERGMSAADIERVIQAHAPKSTKRHERKQLGTGCAPFTC